MILVYSLEQVETAEEFIDLLWRTNFFIDSWSIREIHESSYRERYTFTVKEIEDAVNNSKGIVHDSIKSIDVDRFRQKYPHPSKEKKTQ